MIVPCPLEVTIKSHFALVLIWKKQTPKNWSALSHKVKSLYKLFTSRLGKFILKALTVIKS